MISISLFYCCKKVFSLMNIWMIGKNSMKLQYLKKKILQSKWNSWHIWELLKFMSWNIWTPPCLFSYCERFSMASSFKKKDWNKSGSFNWYWYAFNDRKKVSEAEYVMPFIDMWKLIINTWKIMIEIKNCHILCVGM